MSRRNGVRAAWILAASCLLAAAAGAEPGRKALGEKPRLVFVTTTADCDCSLNRCTVGRQEVDKFLRASPTEIGLEVVDVSKVPEATKTYKTVVLPAAILQGTTGAQIARFDGFFTEGDLLQAWARHRSTKEKRP